MSRMRAVLACVLAWVLAAVAVLPASAAPPRADPPRANQVDVVVLGDSIGFGLWDYRGGFARRYADRLARDGTPVALTNLSVPGWTTGDLLAALQTTRVRHAVANAEVILLEIGGNDLNAARSSYRAGGCDAPPATAAAIEGWQAVVREVDAARAEDARVLTLTLYNPFVDQDRGRDSCADAGDDLTVLQTHLDAYNQAIRDSGFPVADVFEIFTTAWWSDDLVDPARQWYLSFDDFHPNARGHDRIARELVRLAP